jgi:hypothetical protein
MRKKMEATRRKEGGGGGNFTTKGARAMDGGRPQPCQTVLSGFPIYFILFYFFWSHEELPSILGEWVYNTSVF